MKHLLTNLIPRAYRKARRYLLLHRLLRPLLRGHYLLDYVLPGQVAETSPDFKNYRLLYPEERVKIADPAEDPFVPIGKYYRDGWYVRPKLFVTDLPEAVVHVGTGMVCTRKMQVVPDFEYRLPFYGPYGERKPRDLQYLAGTYSTVYSCFAYNIGHWWIDCLPRIKLLAKAEPTAKVTLLMPDSLGSVHRESLECVLPPNFNVAYFPADTWLRVEKFVWPSLISGRCNYHLPYEYYEFMRRPMFARFGLPEHHTPSARIYVTRRGARHRRVLNEDAVAALLTQYGFKSVALEKLTFREQLELFHRAEIVVAPHGAGLNTIMFSGKIRVVVFYPTVVPQNYFHSLAKGMGQEHYFLAYPGREDDHFTVDLADLEKLLRNQLGLKPGSSSSVPADMALSGDNPRN